MNFKNQIDKIIVQFEEDIQANEKKKNIKINTK